MESSEFLFICKIPSSNTFFFLKRGRSLVTKFRWTLLITSIFIVSEELLNKHLCFAEIYFELTQSMIGTIHSLNKRFFGIFRRNQKGTLERQKQRSQIFIKTDVPKNFAIFTGKHLSWTFFSMSCRLQHKCFSVNIAKCLRTTFSQNTFERLLLGRNSLRVQATSRQYSTLEVFRFFQGRFAQMKSVRK